MLEIIGSSEVDKASRTGFVKSDAMVAIVGHGTQTGVRRTRADDVGGLNQGLEYSLTQSIPPTSFLRALIVTAGQQRQVCHPVTEPVYAPPSLWLQLVNTHVLISITFTYLERSRNHVFVI